MRRQERTDSWEHRDWPEQGMGEEGRGGPQVMQAQVGPWRRTDVGPREGGLGRGAPSAGVGSGSPVKGPSRAGCRRRGHDGPATLVAGLSLPGLLSQGTGSERGGHPFLPGALFCAPEVVPRCLPAAKGAGKRPVCSGCSLSSSFQWLGS